MSLSTFHSFVVALFVLGTSADEEPKPRSKGMRGQSQAVAVDLSEVHVCFYPTTRSRPVYCEQVGFISRAYPSDAIRLGELVRDKLAGAGKARLEVGLHVGCVGAGSQRASVLLTRLNMTGRTSTGGKKAAACKDGKKKELLPNSLGGLNVEQASLFDYAEAYVSQLQACEQQKQSQRGRKGGSWVGAEEETTEKPKDPPKTKKEAKKGKDGSAEITVKDKDVGHKEASRRASIERIAVGRVWGRIAKAFGADKEWKGDTQTASVGVRGYCFVESKCAMSDACQGRAHANAFAVALRQSGYDGCNANATPAPGSSNTCYSVLDWKKKKTSKEYLEAAKKLKAEFCKERAGAMQGRGVVNLCQSRPKVDLVKQQSVCKDPRAICAPEGAEPPPFNPQKPPKVGGDGGTGPTPPKPMAPWP